MPAGRPPEGWRLKLKRGRKTYTVVYTHNGREVERSTGRKDPREASEVAARIYADAVQKEPQVRRVVRRGDSTPLEEVVTLWLTLDTTIAPTTVETFTTYGRHWCWLPPTPSGEVRPRWESLVDVTDATVKQYRNDRLTVVTAGTVRHELSALRKFLEWCTENGPVPGAPERFLTRTVTVCGVPKKTTGQRFEKRRRKAAPELSPEEVEALLAALPVWAAKGAGLRADRAKMKNRFPVRARFLVGYETGLRPSFLDVLRVPEHYRKGRSTITILVEHDKNRIAREVELTERARAALDAICPDIGPIFGKHDYRIPLGRAAAEVLPPHKAAVFNGAHFRSAQATHTLELTGNIPGAMELFGWTQVSTASRYTRPSQRAARKVIDERDAARAQAAKGGKSDGRAPRKLAPRK